MSNRTHGPMVVKLRDSAGRAAAALFVAPGEDADIAGLPDGTLRIEYAIGELWSRACGTFAAGMCAARIGGPAALATLAVPPEPGAAEQPVEIDDREFDRE